MQEVDCDLTRHNSKGLSEVHDVEFDAVVTMGCGDACSRLRARRREVWDLPAPKDMPLEEFRVVRDRIEEKVRALLTELGVGPGAAASLLTGTSAREPGKDARRYPARRHP
jgi:protein-tyrosine-phosphatase